MGETRYYGIRHHGPGSARALLRALEEFSPDRICMEFPADGQEALKTLRVAQATPPLALLFFDPKEPERAVSLPLAEFSPEWQAMQYAFDRDIPVRCIDLPFGFRSKKAGEPARKEDQRSETAKHAGEGTEDRKGEVPEVNGKTKGRTGEEALPTSQKTRSHVHPFTRSRFQEDPLRVLARLAGYEEVEQWWDETFEQKEFEGGLFPRLEALMESMREDEQDPGEETRLRERWMNASIRQEEAAHPDARIAVVCGAFHLPALRKENAELPAGRLERTALRWIPWSYERLSRTSGYGAGIEAPHWYECIFRQENISRYWISTAARMLRKKGHMASSAHVIEALQLLEQLQHLKGGSQPALALLERVIITALCEGNKNIFYQIKEELYTGDRIGELPELMQRLPIQIDFEKRLKRFRLGTLPHKSETMQRELDLRKERHLELSRFLHELLALDIPLGRPHTVYKARGGTFTERWELRWEVEFEIDLLRAGAWGNTVHEAAENMLLQRARNLGEFGPLSASMELALKAQLWKPFSALVRKLRDALAVSSAVGAWMQSFPELVRSMKYGHIREYPTDALRMLIEEMFHRLASRLHAWLHRLPTEHVAAELKKLQNVSLALESLEDSGYFTVWLDRLEELPVDEAIDPRIRGWSCRILYEQGRLDLEELTGRLRRESARGSSPLETAGWLEGMIYANALTFLRQQQLVDAVDDWLQSLEEEHFRQILPVLRRALTGLSKAEKQRLWSMIFDTQKESVQEEKDLTIELPPYVKRLLEY